MHWYSSTNPTKLVYYQNCHTLIIKPLLLQGKIIRVDRGIYQLTETKPITCRESYEYEPKVREPPSQEDKEFFDYLESKQRQGGPK
jgi:hypothetical protein